MPDFRALLSKQADSVRKPPILPAGPYVGLITKRDFGESDKKKTPYVRFMLGLTGPGEGLDPASLVDPADGSPLDITKKQFRKDFFLTPDSEYRLVEFLESLGIQKIGRTLAEMIEDALNKPVLIDLVQKPTQAGDEMYNEVANVKGQPA